MSEGPTKPLLLPLLQVNLTSAAHHCFGLTLPRMQGVSLHLLKTLD